AAFGCIDGTGSDGLLQTFRYYNRLYRIRRKIHFDPSVSLAAGEQAAEGLESYRFFLRGQAGLEQYVRSGEGRMSTKRNFHLGGKPAKAPVVAFGKKERCLR